MAPKETGSMPTSRKRPSRSGGAISPSPTRRDRAASRRRYRAERLAAAGGRRRRAHPIHDSDVEDLGDFENDRRGREDRHQDRRLTRVEFAGVSCDDDGIGSSSLLSPIGRLARGPFALAVIAVYLASFASQLLLSAPVTAQVGVVPFVLVQVALIWVWIVLHAKRLRDAGRPTGIVIGIAMHLRARGRAAGAVDLADRRPPPARPGGDQQPTPASCRSVRRALPVRGCCPASPLLAWSQILDAGLCSLVIAAAGARSRSSSRCGPRRDAAQVRRHDRCISPTART